MHGTVRIFKYKSGHLNNFSEKIGQIRVHRSIIKKCEKSIRGHKKDIKRIKKKALALIPRGTNPVKYRIEWEDKTPSWNFFIEK